MRAGQPSTIYRRGSAMLLIVLAGCGGSATGSADPNASSELRTVAQDRKSVKKALVTPADLGTPWVMPSPTPTPTPTAEKTDEPSGGPSLEASERATDEPTGEASKDAESDVDEFCPGQPAISTLVPPRASADTSLTAGTKPGAAIGTFGVATLHPGQEKAWRDAVGTALEGCRTYRQKDDGFYVTANKIGKLPQIKGAEEVLGIIERIHEDIEHKKLLYVRHYLYARTGRLVSTTQYAFIQPKSDPTGSDLTQVVKLASKQVAKANAVFRR